MTIKTLHVNIAIEENIKRLFETTNNYSIKYMFNLLYQDYYKAKHLNFSNWKSDVLYQCDTVVKCFSSINNIPYTEIKDETEINEIYRDILNDFNYSVNHIGQADNFNRIFPYSSFKNTGVYDKILKFYYGIIKGILSILYSRNNEYQSELIPIVTIDVVTIPKSTIYLDNYNNDINKRLITISLPMDVWYNIPYYTPLLVHEIAHYVCPLDREKRNKSILHIMLSKLLEMLFSEKYKSSDIDREYILQWLSSGNEESFCLNYKIDYSATWKKFFAYLLNDVNQMYRCDKHNSIKELFIKFVHSYKNNDDNVNTDYISSEMCNEMVGYLKGISCGIREAIADRHMVDFMRMDLPTYISYLIVARIKCENKNPKNCDDKSVETSIRIGVMFEYIESHLRENRGTMDISYLKNKLSYSEINRITCSLLLRNSESEDDALNTSITLYYDSILSTYIKYRNDFLYYNDFLFSLICSDDFNIEQIIENLLQIKKQQEEAKQFIKFTKFIKNTVNSFDAISNGIREVQNQQNNKTIIQTDTFIKLIESFRYQPSLEELSTYKMTILEFKTIYKPNDIVPIVDTSSEKFFYDDSIYLDSVDKIPSIFLYIIKELCDEDKSVSLWYRGQMNKNWKLNPTIFRKEDNFRESFINAYEKFRADAWGGVELYGSISSKADWIAYMQHYLVPTNFLDWSEQPLSSLYFALENYFEDFCRWEKNDPMLVKCPSSEKANNINNSSVLFVLNPERMNAAFYKINRIPNLSLANNEVKYKSLLVPDFDEDYVELKNLSELINKQLCALKNPKEDVALLPLAIQTSQINSRLRAQRGHFVAFNPNIRFQDSELKDKFDLCQIQQEFYKESISAGEKFKPFLKRIIIPVYAKKRVAEWVKSMNVSLSKIYPELSNIGKDVTRNIFE